MADRTVTVAPTGGDYATLAAAISGEITANAEITVDNGSGGAGNLTIEIQGSWANGDTAAVAVNGFTTSAACRLIIQTDSSNRALKTGIDTGRYRFAATSGFDINDNYVTVDGLQFVEGANYSDMLTVATIAGTNEIIIQNCRFRSGAAARTVKAIYINDADVVVKIHNTIIADPEVEMREAILVNNSSSVDIYNCTIEGCTQDAIERVAGTVTVKNCAVFNNTNDFAGTLTIDCCASDDGDGTNPVAPSGAAWNNEFTDSTVNFTLLNTGNLYDAGVGPGSDANAPSPDIDGTTRSGATCDIGADEYAAGGTTYQVTAGDGLAMADTPSGAVTFAVGVADGFAGGDSPGGVLDIPVSIADGSIFSEAAAGAVTFSVTLADGLVLSDQPTSGGAISVSVADGINLGDSASAVSTLMASVADGIQVSDSTAGTLRVAAAIADGVSFSDAIAATFKFLVAVQDGVTLADIAVDSSVTIEGLVSVTITAKRASVTITAKRPEVAITATRPEIDITGATT